MPRVAYALSRRTGNAVARNRVRRRIRGALQSLPGPLAPGLYLFSSGPAAATLPFDALRAHVAGACAAATAGARQP